MAATEFYLKGVRNGQSIETPVFLDAEGNVRAIPEAAVTTTVDGILSNRAGVDDPAPDRTPMGELKILAMEVAAQVSLVHRRHTAQAGQEL